MFQNECSVDFCGFVTVRAGSVSTAETEERMGEAEGCWRCARKSLCTVFSWIARSSGRLSRTRLRVLSPQSLDFTRAARVKSQPLFLDVGSTSISMSVVPSRPGGKRVGDCASGVERVPKLDIDVGDASSKCLRLMPIVLILNVVDDMLNNATPVPSPWGKKRKREAAVW